MHAHLVDRYGGSRGLRDVAALQSALAMPEATFDGKYLHETVFEQAAAYLFHVARNHPFIDGNKRAGFACALAFLRLNGHRIMAREDDAVDLVLRVATGEASKAEAAMWLQMHVETT